MAGFCSIPCFEVLVPLSCQSCAFSLWFNVKQESLGAASSKKKKKKRNMNNSELTGSDPLQAPRTCPEV